MAVRRTFTAPCAGPIAETRAESSPNQRPYSETPAGLASVAKGQRYFMVESGERSPGLLCITRTLAEPAADARSLAYRFAMGAPSVRCSADCDVATKAAGLPITDFPKYSFSANGIRSMTAGPAPAAFPLSSF